MAVATTEDPILIWGAGAIGGTLGAFWARAGHDVLLVDTVAEHVEACRSSGLRISGPVAEFTQVIPAATPAELTGRYSRIVLAVKAQATEAAIPMLAPHLAPDGFVFSAQNGLNEIALSHALGAARVIGCFVNFGADWHGPGHILFGNRSAVVLGELDGVTRPRTEAMFALAREFEPDAILTPDIWSYLWGKMAYAGMLFATALNDDSMSRNFADPDRMPVWRTLGAEAVATALAQGVTPRGFGGFDPMAFAPGADPAEAEKVVDWLRDFNAIGAKTHSGIWRDLAVRRRKTEAEAQIGLIPGLAAAKGVPVPMTERLCALIADIEAGRRPQSAETFSGLLA